MQMANVGQGKKKVVGHSCEHSLLDLLQLGSAQ